MALSLNTVWEVRTVGANTNGGGFVTGAAGTDYSQQDSAQYALTNGVTNGTTTIATVSAATDMVGNIVYVAGGTGSVVGAWYQITAVSAGVSITVDRTTGLTAGTGVTLNVGGALATLAQMFVNFSVAGMTAYVKATATYSIGTGLTVNTATTTTTANRVIGYTTTRTDLGRVTVQATAAITMVAQSTAGWSFENFIFDGNSATGTNGINSTAQCRLFNVTIKNLSGYGVTVNGAGVRPFDMVEVSGCGGSAGIVLATGSLYLNECYIHDNTVTGITVADILSLVDCVIANNSGSSSDGIQLSGSTLSIMKGCVIYNNGRDGLRYGTSGLPIRAGLFVNNIFDSNGAWGINESASGSTKQVPTIRSNAFRNNGSGQITTETMLNAVTLSADPFTNAGADDFTLNNTAGGGAACRAAGSPGSFIGLSALGYRDIGTFQHEDSGGGSTIVVQSFNPVIVNRFGVSGY